MTPCRNYRVSVEKYLDNELKGEAKQELEAHIEQCSTCSESVRQISILRNKMLHLPQRKVNDDFLIVLRHKLQKSQSTTEYRSIINVVSRWVIGPVVGISFGVMTFFMLQLSQGSKSNEKQNFRNPGFISASEINNNQIHYVIDDNVESVMLSRNDSQKAKQDSLKRIQSRSYRGHVAQVSF